VSRSRRKSRMVEISLSGSGEGPGASKRPGLLDFSLKEPTYLAFTFHSHAITSINRAAPGPSPNSAADQPRGVIGLTVEAKWPLHRIRGMIILAAAASEVAGDRATR
jgi:hypothetical protein